MYANRNYEKKLWLVPVNTFGLMQIIIEYKIKKYIFKKIQEKVKITKINK